MTEKESDDTYVVCGKPIKEGEGRFLVEDGAAHIKCYDERDSPTIEGRGPG